MEHEVYTTVNNRIIEVYVNGAVSFCTTRLGCDRVRGPSLIFPNGAVSFCFEGAFHRSSGPAVIKDDGSVEYYMFGSRIDPVHWFLQGAANV